MQTKYTLRMVSLNHSPRNVTRTYLKNNLSAHGGVAKRFKMLTYYVYAPLFHRFALALNTNLIF